MTRKNGNEKPQKIKEEERRQQVRKLTKAAAVLLALVLAYLPLQAAQTARAVYLPYTTQTALKSNDRAQIQPTE